MKPSQNIARYLDYSPISIIINLLWVYICYMICRGVMLYENWQLFAENLNFDTMCNILRGGLRFDTSAIIYSNLPYLLMVLIPCHYLSTPVAKKIAKWLYVGINALFIVINLIDCVYFAFSQRRATLLIFREFGMNTNNASIMLHEACAHWYLVLLAALLIYLLCKLYRPTLYPAPTPDRKRYYWQRSICFAVCAPILFLGMRGGLIVKGNKPLSVGEAHQYVTEAVQTGLVMNTTFSMIRLSMRNRQLIPQFYKSLDEAESIAPFTHHTDSAQLSNKNVLIIVIEGFSQEFIGAFNGDSINSNTPFFDSLVAKSLRFKHSIANGWLSLDAIPSIQASIPKMYDSFVYSQYSLNDTPGIARELRNVGYNTAFFHGGENSTLGLKAAAMSTGIERYYGRDQYDASPLSKGKADFDGTWAIWDEEFLQYTAAELDKMPQPFYATVFTATTHHPYALPKKYESLRKDTDPHPIIGCVRYSDHALQRFFETISTTKWFKNTIFVITADHCFREIVNAKYNNDLGRFTIPLLFYDPSGNIEPGLRQGVAQQIDVMPTVLNAVGYGNDYMALGINLLDTDDDDTWAITYQDFPQIIKGNWLLQLDGFKPSALYDISTDKQLKNNLINQPVANSSEIKLMEAKLKAILQVYDQHMKADNLIIKK